jgi:hypothetical protein
MMTPVCLREIVESQYSHEKVVIYSGVAGYQRLFVKLLLLGLG